MEEILAEIRELKAQQRMMSNLVIENGKRNEMVLTVLKELLAEMHQTDDMGGSNEIMEQIMGKLDVIVEYLSD